VGVLQLPRIRKELLVNGDRLLIRPQDGEERTESGLVLPATAVNEQQVRQGKVVKVGPGIPVADPMDGDEPWKKHERSEARYVPLQAREGDTAIFLKKASIEISHEGEKYLIVPNSAVLLLAREDIDLGGDLTELEGL
jgi:co-chaperonin GroES (HSP10)